MKNRDDGISVVGGHTTTVATYFGDWLAGSGSRLRDQTRRTYERHLRIHVIPLVGRRRLDHLRAVDLQRLYQTLLDGGLSPTTVRHVHAIITSALT